MSSVTRHKCFLCLDTVSTGKINRPYYKVHLENIHNVSCNTEKLLNWLIEQRPAPKPSSSSRGRPASTLSSVANLMGMRGITITKDTSTPTRAAIPETLINIKGITVQKVSNANDDIEIIDDDVQDVQEYEQYEQQQPQYVQQQPVQYSNYGYPQPVRGRGMTPRHGMQPVAGGRGGNMMMQTTRGRGMQMPVRGVRGAMGTRGRGGGQLIQQQNNILKQQEAAIEKWANSCEHGCRICKRDGKSFTTLVRQNLVKHLDTVHNIAEKDYKAEFKVQSLITRASNIVCTLCNSKVKRLPVSLSTHMKKHKMTIRQYWMKYVAPQGSPLATFQPRSMGGPVMRGGQHPAMRGMSPGRGGVMVPSRGGMTPSRGMRGGRGMMRGMMSGVPMARNDLVIGEVFSVNGGAEAPAGSQLQSEIEIDNKNVLLQGLNDSGDYSSMEVECDPLSMLDTSQESVDTKDFLIDGVPVKADPDSVNTEYYETNPNIDVKPDIKKLMKDEPPDQPQPEGSQQVSVEEGSSQNADMSDQEGPIFHIDSVTSEHVPSETPEDNSQTDNNVSFDITGEKISDDAGEKEGGGGDVGESETPGTTEDPFSDLNDVLDVVRAQEDSHDAHESLGAQEPHDAHATDQQNTDVVEGGTETNNDQQNLDAGDDNAMDGQNQEVIMSGGGEINMTTSSEDPHGTVQDTGSSVDEFVQSATDSSTQKPTTWQQQPHQNYWFNQPCPYLTPGCPLFCCHVRATQEVREGTTDWNMPYGPPADGGGVPCTCCVNDSGGE